VNFLAVDDHVGRRGNAEANLIPAEADYGDDNIVAYAQ
jgi:hypothetical protein